uniref:Uncharacterized protein n=1 Tax=Chrysemys picta bellii TaxID=8478 RepID=A0A8C3H9R1_CHRPI
CAHLLLGPTARLHVHSHTLPPLFPYPLTMVSMASDNALESLREEATCPICLEYFKDPVIIDCGHNLCRACIAQCWEGSNTDISCPQCRETVQQGNLRPNRQLANVVEIAKRLSLQMRPALRRYLDVTLDPDTANPKLILSEDRKCVRLGDTRQDQPNNPERFDPCACVLGAEEFVGGRRYWEVEVGDKPKWDLGVCRESVSRKGDITLTTKQGYWAVTLRNGDKYSVSTSPWTPLPVSVRPSRVGIFLDYEAGEVSFYNVTDRSHLFTFTDTFSGTLRPYFCPCNNTGGTNTAPLIICPVPAQAGGNLCP